MSTNPALASESLAFRRDTCHQAKQLLAFCNMPNNDVEEGVIYDGDAEGTVHFRFYFPNASTVSVAIPVSSVDLQKSETEEGVWVGTSHYPPGLQCVNILVDLQDVCSPYLPMGYNYSRPVNYIDVPPMDLASCHYAMRSNINYGTVAHDFFTTSEGTVEQLLVYLPPSYRKEDNATRRYPVLYLQHGLGENENAWVQHGKLNVIADNLIADGQMTDMLIVMGNGMMYDMDGVLEGLGYVGRLVKDVIPYVDSNYRTKSDRSHRAVAGLSMGSTQATYASMEHPDLFTAVGIFSGFMRPISRGRQPGEENHFTRFLQNSQPYRDAMKLVFRCMGLTDPFLPVFEADTKSIEKVGFKEDVRKMYPGGHCWQVWRHAIADFLPLIFRE